MFIGQHAHTLDAKGRLSIPVDFRSEFQRFGEGPPILTNLKACLALYPYQEWMKLANEVQSRAKVDPKVQAFRRFVMFGASPCPMDKQGRILVPTHLREHARLERDVVVAGNSDYVEIWNPELLKAELAHTLANYDELASNVDSRGQGVSKEV
jgi:MraZ protein